MSLAEHAPGLMFRRGRPLAESSGDFAGLYRLPVYIACTILVVAANYLLGKDMAWDTQQYHLYAGFSAVNDRFGQDYFAAGPQSYFNPYAYVPFYALVSAGLSALEISSALAVAHSIVLWLTYELGVRVCPSDDRRARVTTGLCAVALAFVNPILLQEIGSTFADITTAILVLAGWLLLAAAVRTPHAVRLVFAGLLLGAASALKLTNSAHAIAGFVVLILLPLSLRGRIRHSLAYGVSLAFGFVMVAAPWSYRLEQMFGNPLFPLMNSVFRSPEFTTVPLRHLRFIPATFGEAVWRPFAMIDPRSMVHEELRAPDLRYAVLLALLIVLCLRWLWRRFAHPSTLSTPVTTSETTRVLAALGFGLATDWVLWLSASGNSRYFLAMGCVAAVVITGLLFRLFATQPKVGGYILAAILGIQVLQLRMGTEFRWNPVPWGGRWYDIAVPEKLRTEPSLYLTVGMQSNSFIDPFLAKGSGLINFSGGYALGLDGAVGARIEALIQRYTPHLRVLLVNAQPYEGSEGQEMLRVRADVALERLGLRADASDCATITVHGLPPLIEDAPKSSMPSGQQAGNTTYLVSCHLVIADPAERAAQIARQRAVDVVFDRLEDTCPELFQPSRARSERFGAGWVRRYVNTDLMAMISNGGVKFVHSIRGDDAVFVGRE
ncbi:MAG: hypothetical protein JWN85_1668, partial [Gammaproteobacteria bacterium]|nr:hypothetical protein [Gammaproteobacteria bacterium]